MTPQEAQDRIDTLRKARLILSELINVTNTTNTSYNQLMQAYSSFAIIVANVEDSFSKEKK